MRTEVRTYRDLVAWQKAFEFSVVVHELTKLFPKDELYGLTSQMRRGSVGVPSNIAEDYGRGSTTDYLRFLRVARGCLFELDTQLLCAFRFRYITREMYDKTLGPLEEATRVLAGLIRGLEKSRQNAE